MMTYYIQRPSVPSSSEVPIQGSGNDDDGAEGAKNRWVRTVCHWKLKICTYNARSLFSDDRVTLFEDEIANIKFDIIGISETRRKGEGCLTHNKSGHTFYYKGGDTCHRGVGFIVSKNIAGNVTSFKSVSDRLAQLTIRINGEYHLNITQAYLPTSRHDDQEVENVYEDIVNLITNSKAHYNVIIGDFDGNIGLRVPAKYCIGHYGLGARDTGGNSLIYFAESHQLKIMNTFFKKRLHRRWTWISPNGVTRNEIDYIFTDKPQTFTDVSVINSFNTGSDHRMIRGSMTINTRQDRARFIKRPSKANAVALSAKVAECQLLLTNKFEDLNSQLHHTTLTPTVTVSPPRSHRRPLRPRAKTKHKYMISSPWSQSSYGRSEANEEKWNRCATHRIYRDLQSYQKSNVRGHQQLQ